jgi:hypothetical protein
MNANPEVTDTDVLRAVADCLSGVPVPEPPPLEAVVARGRARRRHRLIPGVAGALAVAAGVALGVSALAPVQQPTAHLAAWTVTRQPNGTIAVTIRDLRDPAGLQRKLRAAGVPARVVFTGHRGPWPVPACHILAHDGIGVVGIATVTNPRTAGGHPILTFSPSAPAQAKRSGVLLVARFQHPVKGTGRFIAVTFAGVRASPACTGT